MKWEVEKDKRAQLLSCWIENASEEIMFAKTLYTLIKKSSSKEKFIRTAQKRLQEYRDPWIQEELGSILELVT